MKWRKIALCLLALVFLGSAGMLGYELLQYRAGDAVYDEASDLAQLPTLPPLPEEVPASEETPTPEETPVYVDPYADLLRNMDFTALQKVNKQVLGWILIPNTALSYPLLQGEDNDYYLNHTYQKTNSAVGAIFMDYRSAADLSDFNTLVYGHRMNNGSMFASLKYYKKQSYWQKHKTVYLTTSAGSFAYEIFSAYEGSASGESYRQVFKSEEKKQAFLDFAVGASVIKTGVTPTVHDSILTLSTCTGNGHANRLIVHAVRKNYAPSDTAEAAPAAPAPVAPAPPAPVAPAPPAPVAPAPPAPVAPAPAPTVPPMEETPVSDVDAASI